MKQRFFCLLPFFLPAFLFSQTDASKKGIQWTTALTWKQVKDKAKAEGKYIFIDAFTTWCGPCKAMEKEVYSKDTVSDYFNDHFIAVKLQVDKTKKDDDFVKSWYSTAEALAKEFRIIAYPTLIFLTPSGKMVNKEEGYKDVKQLIAFAQSSLEPGTAYDDPYREYDSLIAAYKKGENNYAKMSYLIETAIKLNDTPVARSLSALYSKYLLGLSNVELFTKEHIGFIANHYTRSSKSKFLKLFLTESGIVDSAMDYPGYSKIVVDRIIQNEDVQPIIKLDPQLRQMGVKKPPDPDWKKLFKTIRKKYNRECAGRNVLQAKIIWYRFWKDWPTWANCFIKRYEKYGIDTLDWTNIPTLNDAGWTIFNEISDPEKIQAAIHWIKGVLERLPKYHSPFYEVMVGDTYANLLYKAGNVFEAIEQEGKVVASLENLSADNGFKQDIISNFRKMSRGEPTWKPGTSL